MQYDDLGSGLPVVLVHGFPLNRKMWRAQQDVLVDHGFRVICPDLPGFGDSPSVEGDATMGAYADAVIGLLDRLGIDKAVVGGMSMGGYVLLNLVERYPERLLGAMFLVTRAAADDAAGKEKRSLLAREVGNGNLAVVPETFAQVLFAPEVQQEQPELVREVRGWMESTPAAGVVGGLLAMRDRDDYVDRLSGFNLPALVVGAEQDMAVPPEHARVLANGLPHAELCIIPGGGHMVNLEQPETFNRIVLGFLEKTLGR
ncbi:MAG: alpha/beta fold hydrolase [Desulfuromonadales bacterium]|nr:alpha/beta fold hydrolase [Desulfuromonadales bacterium]